MIYIDTMSKQPLYIDFDNTIFNSALRICDLYNKHFRYYEDFVAAKPENIQRSDFSDVCPLANESNIRFFFNSPEFLAVEDNGGYYWMSQKEGNHIWTTKGYLETLDRFFRIIIISTGDTSNLALKHKFVKKYLPFADFIGLEAYDKSEVDMSDGILIDDNIAHLRTSNAATKVLYGQKRPWDDEMTEEEKKTISWCKTWHSLYEYLTKYWGV